MVTDSYLELDQDVTKCQNKESFFNCTTRQYVKTVLAECGCLPFNMRLSNKVSKYESIIKYSTAQLFQEPLCYKEELRCVNKVNIETSSCRKPCSGLIVTSYSKTTRDNHFENLPYLKDYENFKIITLNPSTGNKGEIMT